jgi:hypothetical protein
VYIGRSGLSNQLPDDHISYSAQFIAPKIPILSFQASIVLDVQLLDIWLKLQMHEKVGPMYWTFCPVVHFSIPS